MHRNIKRWAMIGAILALGIFAVQYVFTSGQLNTITIRSSIDQQFSKSLQGNSGSITSSQVASESQMLTPKSLQTNTLKYTLMDVRKSQTGIHGEPASGNGIYLILTIGIENTGTTEGRLTAEQFAFNVWELIDNNNRIFHQSSCTGGGIINMASRCEYDIPAGIQVTEKIGFVVPDDPNLSYKLYVPSSLDASSSATVLFGIIS